MPDNYILGMNAKAYLSATLLDGSNTAAVLSAADELTNIRDASISTETAEADITTRGNSGWRQTVGTLRDGSIEFQMIWQPDDANFETVKDAFLAGEELAAVFLDQERTVSGSQGLASNFSVTNFSRSENLEEALLVDVTLRTSSQSEWYEVP